MISLPPVFPPSYTISKIGLLGGLSEGKNIRTWFGLGHSMTASSSPRWVCTRPSLWHSGPFQARTMCTAVASESGGQHAAASPIEVQQTSFNLSDLGE